VTIYQILPYNRHRAFSLIPHDEAIPTSHILITIMQNIQTVAPGRLSILKSVQLSHDKDAIDLPSVRLIFMFRVLSLINVKLSLYLKERLSSML